MEVERGRADDYYLTEGTGFARRYAATADGAVARLPELDGDGYQAWVSGVDPETGVPRGRIRTDERALRFCEVVVNGPKSWSIAAELHSDIAAAYEAAQDRAAEQIVGWFAAHATTRVGPRGAQVATPVERLEAVAVRHYASRAGDPHRHLHLQLNARVFAAGRWRGIDSVAVRDALGAVQGIGHAAVMCDPGFRAALAAHGFTVDAGSGEVVELVGYVEPFSKRAAQVTGQVEGYERAWRAANPDTEPGPGLRRTWDARAWADHRPAKKPSTGAEPASVAHGRWTGELAALGYTPPPGPTELAAVPVGSIDREEAAGEVLARLAARRSAFNQADLRGEAEQLLARRGVIAEAAVRAELVEDLTARAAAAAVCLLGERGEVSGAVPGHVRAWTTAEAIATEAEINDRLAARGAADAVAGQTVVDRAVSNRDAVDRDAVDRDAVGRVVADRDAVGRSGADANVVGRDAAPGRVAAAAAAAGVTLDAAQAEAAAALAGEHALVLVTGAAGAGKTTTLATVRAALESNHRQLLVVTPTLKGARGAAAETGARAGSAAWLVHQHGWRWDEAGRWTRLTIGQADPATGTAYAGPGERARLGAGDLLVVDEAGMLDQDTARALLAVADEAGARLALVGDAQQLAAVGRGGVLDLAGRWAERTVTLDVIHRFIRSTEIAPGVTADVEDSEYAALSLWIREGAAGNPGAVFDALAARGAVRVHTTGEDLRAALAEEVATAHLAADTARRPPAVCAATNEAAGELNTAIRARLIAAGHVDDTTVAVTASGVRIGAGDVVVTRRNDRDLDVANRDAWTVTAVHPDGALTLTPTPARGSGLAGERTVGAGYVRRHVELGYAGTVHGVQGHTAPTGHLVLDEHTTAAAAYVGMTRGRTANTVHLITGDVTDPMAAAREQWLATAGRGRVDTGIDAARAAAQRAAAPYAPPTPGPVHPDPARPASDPDRRAALLDQLRAAWTEQADAAERLHRLEPRLAAAQADAEHRARIEQQLAPLREQATAARAAADAAERRAAPARAALDARAESIHRELRVSWDTDRPVAADAARALQAGPGRFGWLTGARADVADAQRFLDQWADKWRPVLPLLTDPAAAASYAARHPGNDHIEPALRDYAARAAAIRLPSQVAAVSAAQQASARAEQAQAAYTQAADHARDNQASRRAFSAWRDRADDLPALTAQTAAARRDLDHATQRLQRLTTDPALTTQPKPPAQPDPAVPSEPAAQHDSAGWLHTAHTQWARDRDTTRTAAAQRAARDTARQALQAAQRRHHDHQLGHGRDRGGPSIGR